MLAGGLFLGLLITAPAWLAPGEVIIGEPDSEAFGGAWVVWWGQQSLLDNGLPPHWAAQFNFPNGRPLHCLSLLEALLLLPLHGLIDAVSLYNLMIALDIALAFTGCWLLLRSRVDDPWAVVPGALAFATSPYLLGHLQTGPQEVFSMGWIPLALLAIERATRDGGRGRVVLAGLLLAATFLSGPYYFIFTCLGAVWLVLARVRGRLSWVLLGRSAAVGLVAAVPMLPQVWAIARSRSISPRTFDPEMVEKLLDTIFVQDLLSLLLPVSWFLKREPSPTVYLGLALLSLALLGLGRPGWKRWALMAGWAGLFALGTYLEVGGHRLFPLPASLLCKYVPPFTSISHPLRILPLVLLSLGMLSALGLMRLRPKVRRPAVVAAAALVLLDQLALAPLKFPVPTSPAVVPDFYHQIADDPEPYAVLDMFSSKVGLTYGPSLVYQTVHGHALVFDLLPPDPKLMRNQLVAMLGHDPRTGHAPLPRQQHLCEDARALGALGVRYLVKHLWQEADDPRLKLLRRCGLKIAHQDKQVLVFQLDR